MALDEAADAENLAALKADFTACAKARFVSGHDLGRAAKRPNKSGLQPLRDCFSFFDALFSRISLRSKRRLAGGMGGWLRPSSMKGTPLKRSIAANHSSLLIRRDEVSPPCLVRDLHMATVYRR